MRLQHVTIAIPLDGTGEARAFYGNLLGLDEKPVLPNLDPARFVWYAAGGDNELHLQLSPEPPPDKPHFCLAVDDLDELRGRLEGAGVETIDPTPILGRPRFMCRDPFGNLIELVHIDG
ncbi:MAG TPA: VOC family protein [Gaiellaceae bacterium]|jgi:catechol 2,3-dioxygenase-like lactoylglutathione lyase family enzyme|nr:VOC family protein [Gaiellaceae bacterium]